MSLRQMARPVLGAARWLYQRPGSRRLMVELREEFDNFVLAPGTNIKLRVTSRMEHQRLMSFLNKEPDTIEWLNGLNPGDIFLDIGANIGVYSLYAGLVRKARVIAFEPEAHNFAALNANIYRNRLSDLVTAYPLSASDVTEGTTLEIGRVGAGYSLHSLPGAGIGGDKSGHVQGTFSIRLDDFFARRTAPRFVKIDVDGAEGRVLAGMPRLLKELDGLLVEMPVDSAPDSIGGLECRRRPATAGRFGNFIFARN